MVRADASERAEAVCGGAVLLPYRLPVSAANRADRKIVFCAEVVNAVIFCFCMNTSYKQTKAGPGVPHRAAGRAQGSFPNTSSAEIVAECWTKCLRIPEGRRGDGRRPTLSAQEKRPACFQDRALCGFIVQGWNQTCMRSGKRKPMAPVGQLVRQLAQCQHSSPWATSGRSRPFSRCLSSST